MTSFNMLTAPRRFDGPLSDDQLRQIAPSIFGTQAAAHLSDRYAHIPTSETVTAMRSNGFLPVRAAEGRARLDSRRDYMRHVIIFRRADEVARDVGDLIPEIAVDNAHDGSAAYRMMFGLMRLVCRNGMVVSGGNIASMTVRHQGRTTAGKVVDAAYTVVQDAPKVLEQVEQFRQIMLEPPQRQAFAEAAAEIRWGRDAESNNLLSPVATDRLLWARRTDDRGATLWNTLNVVQENVVRGGVSGRSGSGRRLSTRAVNSPAENMRVNRRLWELAANVADAIKGKPAPVYASAAE